MSDATQRGDLTSRRFTQSTHAFAPPYTAVVQANGVSLGDLPAAQARKKAADAEHIGAKLRVGELSRQLAEANQQYRDIMLWKASASNGGWVTFMVDGRLVTQNWLVIAMAAEIGRLDTLKLALSVRLGQAKQRLAKAEEEKRGADEDLNSHATLTLPGQGAVSFRLTPQTRAILMRLLNRAPLADIAPAVEQAPARHDQPVPFDGEECNGDDEHCPCHGHCNGECDWLD